MNNYVLFRFVNWLSFSVGLGGAEQCAKHTNHALEPTCTELNTTSLALTAKVSELVNLKSRICKLIRRAMHKLRWLPAFGWNANRQHPCLCNVTSLCDLTKVICQFGKWNYTCHHSTTRNDFRIPIDSHDNEINVFHARTKRGWRHVVRVQTNRKSK